MKPLQDVELSIREVTIKDLDRLFEMIVESTGGKTKLTADSLRDDFFGPVDIKLTSSDPSIEIDDKILRSNRPVAQAIVAEVNDELVGHLVYHYHYSPWAGNCGSIDDVFVRPDYRRRGGYDILVCIEDADDSTN